MTYTMRARCKCGSITGRIDVRGGQNCVFCDCGAFQYNAPKSEVATSRTAEPRCNPHCPKRAAPMTTRPFQVMTLARTYHGCHQTYMQAWTAGAEFLRAGHRRVAITREGEILTVMTSTPQGGIVGTPAAMWSKPE